MIILLYNGNKDWTASQNIKDLIKSDIPSKYIPDFSYFKVIEKDFSDEALLNIKNALSAVFYVENSTPEKLKSEIDNLVKLIEKESPEIIGIFRNWFTYLLGIKEPEIINKIENILEVKTMFTATLEKYEEKLIKQGKEEGIVEGVKEGIKEKAIDVAKKLLSQGLTIELIADVTGLSSDEVKKLK